jgi:6-pyruvoyltetrahydropterin/6-carboxytetrahydropterin synthase
MAARSCVTTPQGLVVPFQEATMEITLKHNMEIAHRLFLMPGKCQQIHGHSMQVELTLQGMPNKNGIFEGLDFSDVKKRFRAYLDKHFDHHLLLNEQDPWSMIFTLHDPIENDPVHGRSLPGLVRVDGDPTTENLVKWIGHWALQEFKLPCRVTIQETGTNAVSGLYR